jgi:shikimate kinase
VGSRRWTYHLDRALWLALNGRIDEALDAFEAEYCCALSADLTALGVLEDLGGTFHGIARQPRFQRRLEARNREIEELHRRIRGEAPWILTPPS